MSNSGADGRSHSQTDLMAQHYTKHENDPYYRYGDVRSFLPFTVPIRSDIETLGGTMQIR